LGQDGGSKGREERASIYNNTLSKLNEHLEVNLKKDKYSRTHLAKERRDRSTEKRVTK
jgi:hypothetical protein